MCVVRLPSGLRHHCGGRADVEVHASSLAGALAELQQTYPAMKDRVVRSDGGVREFVGIYVNDDGRCVCHRPELALGHADVVSIMSAVPGG